jgi:hypothetical protein
LLIPPDALTPPAPLGAPQLVLVVTALTACLLWSLNPKRRYLRFAASMIAMIVLPGSPLWQLALHLFGLPSMPQNMPVVTQVAMVGVVCLCLWLDYRLHCRQAGVEERLERAVAARDLAMNIAADAKRPTIEVVDLIDMYDGAEKKARNNVFLVLMLSFGSAAAFGAHVVAGNAGSATLPVPTVEIAATAAPVDAATVDAAEAIAPDAASIPIDAHEEHVRRKNVGVAVDATLDAVGPDASIAANEPASVAREIAGGAVDAAVGAPSRKSLSWTCDQRTHDMCVCWPPREASAGYRVELMVGVELTNENRGLAATVFVDCPDGTKQRVDFVIGTSDFAGTAICPQSNNAIGAKARSDACIGPCKLSLRCAAHDLVPRD